MKVTIINQHTNNLGDEAAAKALIHTLFQEFPEIKKLSIIYNGDGTLPIIDDTISHEVDCTLKKMGYANILFKLLCPFYHGNKAMKKFDKVIRESDYVIVTPCGANIGIYKDYRFVIRLIFTIYQKKTPIFYLNTIGKSNSIIFNFLARWVLRRSKVYVRELASEIYLNSLNIQNERGVDTAFLLPYSESDMVDESIITFVISDLAHYLHMNQNDYKDMIVSDILNPLALFAKEKQMKIKVLPHLNTKAEKIFVDWFFSQVSELEYENYFERIFNINNVEDYYREISRSYLVVGMRYHTVVLAAKGCIPFISLSYENKMREVCSYTNQLDFYYSLGATNNINSFPFLLNELYKKRELINKDLKDINQKLMALAMIPLKEIVHES